MKKITIILFIVFILSTMVLFTSCGEENRQNPSDESQSVHESGEETGFEDLDAVTVSNEKIVYDGQYHLVGVNNVPNYATVLFTPKYGYKNAGEYTVNVSVSYKGQKRELSATLTIEKATLTVYAQEKIVTKGSEPTFDYSITGYKGNDNVSCIDVLPKVKQYQEKAVGTYKDEIKFDSAQSDNYDFKYVPANLTVVAKATPVLKSGYVTFGNYPQTVVDDKTVTETLLTKIESGEIISDSVTGYYVYNGKTYAKIVATPYASTMCSDKFSNGKKIVKGETYFFLVEPIKWKVLSGTKKVYLTTDVLLDIHQFDDTRDDYYIEGEKYVANDYTVSYIRSFLLNNFTEYAFDGNADLLNGITITSNGHTVTDNVGLMTKLDVEGKQPNSFGFTDNASRQAKTSDYCKAKGAFTDEAGNGYWWLNESSGIGIGDYCRVAIVKADGDISYDYWDVVNTSCSVRPLIYVEL